MEISSRAQAMVENKATQQKTSKLPLILSLSVIALLVAPYFIFPSFKEGVNEAFDVLTSKDEELVRDWVSQFGVWGPVVIILIMVFQMFLFIIPNILLIMISILSYGPIWGALLAWFGVVLASTVGYLIGNKLSPVTVHKFVSPKTQKKLKEFIGAYGMKAIIVLRLSTFSNDGLSLVAGLLNMEYKKFIIATLIGITPLITLVAIVGKNGKIERILLYMGIFLVIALIVYIAVDRRRRKKKKA
ncbi:MAG: VTT domain-containing protein [Cyclobacteriaceae bacterium]